jgi:hypothetical protein
VLDTRTFFSLSATMFVPKPPALSLAPIDRMVRLSAWPW